MIWNGLKFFGPTGLFLDAEENRELWRLADQPTRTYVPWDQQGKHTALESFIEEHIKAVLRIPWVKPEFIRKKKFKVVLDCVNAAGGIVVPGLLKKLGCKVIELNCECSGVFKHAPEPIPENLTDLCKRVRREKADLGIAVDPDVDRLVLINERGEPFGEEYTIANVVKFVLEHQRKRTLTRAAGSKSVVINLSTTRAVEDIAASYGYATIRTPVGEINVAKKMKEVGAVVGGEGSGGVILPNVHLGRDALVGIVLTLQHLAEFGGTMSELKQSMPQYMITKGRVELRGINPDSALNRIQQKFQGKGTVNTDDGLKIDFPDSWVHLRKSNTEPIIRIIAEAHSKEAADSLVQEFTGEIQDV
jgi:phosphomannomutase